MSFGSRSLPPPTDEQKWRWHMMREHGCLLCNMAAVSGGSITEIHHLLSGGLRMGHDYTIALCAYHHRGVGDGFGPSLAHGGREFRREWGNDEYLLREQNELIGWTKAPVRERRRKSKCTASNKQVKRPKGGFA